MKPLRIADETLSWAESVDEIVILNLKTSRYLVVNSSGRQLWRLLSNGSTRDELVAALADAHSISKEEAELDVESFLSELDTHGLLQA